MCYHLKKRTKKLDNELLGEFKHTNKDLCLRWYKADKQFKLKTITRYPTCLLRRTYQFMLVVICRLYRDSDASKFPLLYMPSIYHSVEKELSFNWDDILSTNLAEAIIIVVEAPPGTFPYFHMSLYLI
jgi:hypothetical protein